MIPKDCINRAWEIYARFTYHQNGCPEHNTDRMHWVSGFASALAVITGGMDVGITEGELSKDVIDRLVNVELGQQQDMIDAAMRDAIEHGVRRIDRKLQ